MRATYCQRRDRLDRLRQAFERFLDQTHMMEHRGVGRRGIARQNGVDDFFVFVVRARKAPLRAKLRAAKGGKSPSQSGGKIGNDAVMSALIDLRMQRKV